jgi:hypothetical protein
MMAPPEESRKGLVVRDRCLHAGVRVISSPSFPSIYTSLSLCGQVGLYWIFLTFILTKEKIPKEKIPTEGDASTRKHNAHRLNWPDREIWRTIPIINVVESNWASVAGLVPTVELRGLRPINNRSRKRG